MFSFQELQTVTYLRNSFFELWSGTALFRSLIHFYSTIFDKFMIQGWGFTPTTTSWNPLYHERPLASVRMQAPPAIAIQSTTVRL